ncbi:hypothetical protein BKA70DRAFT_1285669 [Coprinopsis sp. MPI-PUGE-AT-0042]|nr:hypothetical protein BKA70DRAFT_1285669 [Coprinopsis sp. MPI-PUGE-AT-0042]
MGSTIYRPGFDTQSCCYEPSHSSKESDQGLPQPTNALGRSNPQHHDCNDRSSTSATTATFFGGLLDSPLVQIKPRNADIPLSPPPTEPTTQSALPPLIDASTYASSTLDNSASAEDNKNANDGKLGFGKPISSTSSPLTTSYSPPLSPVGTSPSFTSLSLSLAPITSRHHGESHVPTASPPLASHDSITEPPPDAKVLLSPLSPEWGADFVGDDEEHDAPVSIEAVLSDGGFNEGTRIGRDAGNANSNEGELDDLGLADDEDGSNVFAFAGFLTRGSRPRLSMLEIPPSAFPPATLSPSSYFPSATSASASSLWKVDETPVSALKSSLWQVDDAPGPFSVVQGEARDGVSSPSDPSTPTPPFALFSDEGSHWAKEYDEAERSSRSLDEPQLFSGSQHSPSFEHDYPTSPTPRPFAPSVHTIDLFPSNYDEHHDGDAFNAYHSPQLQFTSLPDFHSSPHVSFNELPEDVYHEPTLLLSSNEDFSSQRSSVEPLGLDFDTDSILTTNSGHVTHTCNDGEYAKLSSLLECLQASEKEAKAKETEALAAIAALRSPGLSISRSSPALPQTTTAPPLAVSDSTEPSTSPSTHGSSILPSMSVAELQKVAADARRAAKKARSRAKEISGLLKFKLDERPSSDSLFPSSPIDPLLDSPSPPMLFEPLDDATQTSAAVISPPFPILKMGGFATSPPVFSSANKSLSKKRKGCGGVDHLVAKMILKRREAGSSLAATPQSSSPLAGANAKAVFLSPLLGQHHQLQLQQRYKFLRSSPLARNVVTLPATPRSVNHSTMPTPLPSALALDSFESSSNGPSRSNSLDSTCSTDTACSSSSSSSSLWSDWDSDGETSFGEGDELPDLDDQDEDEDVEMGFQALKTPLMWGLDLGFDGGVEKGNRVFGVEDVTGDGEEVERGGEGRGLLLPAL